MAAAAKIRPQAVAKAMSMLEPRELASQPQTTRPEGRITPLEEEKSRNRRAGDAQRLDIMAVATGLRW
jgi:hypothetical protein